MNTFRRILSVVLTLMLVLFSFPVSVLGSEDSGVETTATCNHVYQYTIVVEYDTSYHSNLQHKIVEYNYGVCVHCSHEFRTVCQVSYEAHDDAVLIDRANPHYESNNIWCESIINTYRCSCGKIYEKIIYAGRCICAIQK